MKAQLFALFLLMPILACSAQFDWLWARRRGNVMAPQRQSSFGFMAVSTTPQPSFGGGKQKSWRRVGAPASSIDTIAGDVAGGASFNPMESVPPIGDSGSATNTVGTGDTSTNVDGSEWISLGNGRDYGGNSGNNGGGGGGGNGGASTGTSGGMGGTSGGAGGSVIGGGALDPSLDDTMQSLNKASAGSIAGIVIGVIILLCVLAGVSFFVMRQVHRKVQVGGMRA
ncbi:uncharacterized protein [Diadema antillarum]|uniref:uncharacterized protein n=1 Tax=Diadema antillarum TaxID=105358 RepID=UPI003A85E2FE